MRDRVIEFAVRLTPLMDFVENRCGDLSRLDRVLPRKGTKDLLRVYLAVPLRF
jgi:hypothetical protein